MTAPTVEQLDAFAVAVRNASTAELERIVAAHRARLASPGTTAEQADVAAYKLERIEAELAGRHDYRREERDDAVRMVCRCGKRSRWGTFADLARAADRHADETARAAR